MTLDCPTETVLWVNCTQCGKLREANTLMPIPFYHPFKHEHRIALLCGLCQWKMRPKETVSCVGTD